MMSDGKQLSKSASNTRIAAHSPRSTFYIDTEEEQAVNKYHVIRRGYLKRQMSKPFPCKKHKWMVLVEDCIFCYDDKTELKLYERISLTNKIVSIVNGSNNSGSSNSGRYYFQIAAADINSDGRINTSKVELFGASSEEERKEWMLDLKKAMYSKVGGAIFGGTLEDTLTFERSRNSNRVVPEIVEECIRFLQEHGMDVEGIFRHTGKQSLLKQLQLKFDRGERPTFIISSSLPDDSPLSSSSSSSSSTPHNGSIEGVDVHLVASLLKSYLLKLPEPIIPVDFSKDVMDLVTGKEDLSDKTVDKISLVISQIPANSYNLLRYLYQFLKLVGDNESQNRMSYKNLAKMFCNAIIEPEDDDPSNLMRTADDRAKAVTVMMTYFDQIFKEDWKKDTGVKMPTKCRPNRFLRSYISLSTEDDSLSSSFNGDKSLSHGSIAELRISKSSKSFELLNSQKSSRDEDDSSVTLSRCDRSSSASTISKFFDSFPKIGSYKKSTNEFLDSSRSSFSSEHFQDSQFRGRHSSTSSAINMKNVSRKDFASKEKLLHLRDWYGSPNFRQILRNPYSYEELGQVAELDPIKDDIDIQYLLEVKPKSLTVDDLIEHFYNLQDRLAAEHNKANDLAKENSKEVNRLNREMEEHKEGREQAVMRVVELQTKLEKYFLKYGPLSDSFNESDTF